MTYRECEQLIERLENRGFDACKFSGPEDPGTDDHSVDLGCSQCQATAINGLACHEHGCPNA